MRTYLFVHTDTTDNLQFSADNLLEAVSQYADFIGDTCIDPDSLVAILEIP